MPETTPRGNIELRKGFYRPALAQVLSVERKDWEGVLELEPADKRPLGHSPGQFVQVSVFGYGEIPISVCSSPTRPGGFQLCVRPAGHVSKALHERDPGDWVGIRGPYGRGFPMEAMKGCDVVLAAGGIGLAPLRGVIQFMIDRREDYGRLVILYGAKTPAYLLFEKDLEKWSQAADVELVITVDRADETWRGRTGVITEPLRDLDLDPEGTLAAVVGPPVMYRFVAMELFKKGMNAEQIYFSLERRFKCGIGKCGHCQLNDLYVCRDGPVFLYSQLLGRSEAVEVWAPEEKDAGAAR